jgi:hypothetical protein
VAAPDVLVGLRCPPKHFSERKSHKRASSRLKLLRFSWFRVPEDGFSSVCYARFDPSLRTVFDMRLVYTQAIVSAARRGISLAQRVSAG